MPTTHTCLLHTRAYYTHVLTTHTCLPHHTHTHTHERKRIYSLDKKYSHRDLIIMVDGAELERGSATAGGRGYYLKGPLVLLENALIQYGLHMLHEQSYVALSPPGMCINAPSSIISGCGRELLAILNSQVSDYYIRSLGVTRSGGYFEYKPMFVEQLPVPDLNENLRMLLANLANYVLLASTASMDLHRAFFENVIDGLVFEL